MTLLYKEGFVSRNFPLEEVVLGFAAPNRSSWNFRYTFFFYEVLEAEIFRVRRRNPNEHRRKILELGS